VGGPTPVLQGVAAAPSPNALPGAGASYAISDSGTLVYVPRTDPLPVPERTLVWVDRQGSETPLGAPPRPYLRPRINQDGTRVALSVNVNRPGFSGDCFT
jgi:hypothetical protein